MTSKSTAVDTKIDLITAIAFWIFPNQHICVSRKFVSLLLTTATVVAGVAIYFS